MSVAIKKPGVTVNRDLVEQTLSKILIAKLPCVHTDELMATAQKCADATLSAYARLESHAEQEEVKS